MRSVWIYLSLIPKDHTKIKVLIKIITYGKIRSILKFHIFSKSSWKKNLLKDIERVSSIRRISLSVEIWGRCPITNINRGMKKWGQGDPMKKKPHYRDQLTTVVTKKSEVRKKQIQIQI